MIAFIKRSDRTLIYDGLKGAAAPGSLISHCEGDDSVDVRSDDDEP